MSRFDSHIQIGRHWSLVVFLAVAGCKDAQRAQPETSEPSPSADNHDELTAKYNTMTPAERVQAAMKICYVGRDCDGAEARALLEAGVTPAEREALKATARSTFTRQYTAHLTEQGKRPDSMTLAGDGLRTLKMTGDACSRFLLENFAGGAGKTAKLIGFTRFECESEALRAGIDL